MELARQPKRVRRSTDHLAAALKPEEVLSDSFRLKTLSAVSLPAGAQGDGHIVKLPDLLLRLEGKLNAYYEPMDPSLEKEDRKELKLDIEIDGPSEQALAKLAAEVSRLAAGTPMACVANLPLRFVDAIKRCTFQGAAQKKAKDKIEQAPTEVDKTKPTPTAFQRLSLLASRLEGVLEDLGEADRTAVLDAVQHQLSQEPVLRTIRESAEKPGIVIERQNGLHMLPIRVFHARDAGNPIEEFEASFVINGAPVEVTVEHLKPERFGREPRKAKVIVKVDFWCNRRGLVPRFTLCMAQWRQTDEVFVMSDDEAEAGEAGEGDEW